MFVTYKDSFTLSKSKPNIYTMIVSPDIIITSHIARLDGYMLHGQAFKKPKTYLIIEMIPILVYYSYERKYHNLTSMFVPGYQCSYVYIDIEKGTLLYKDIQ